jgi:hypothetical protein
MKKIVIITASVFALGAASIAADAGGMHYPGAMNLPPVSATPAVEGSKMRGDSVFVNPIAQKVRLVSPNIEPVNSCDAAYWPYYPGACLERVETAGL